MSCPMLLQYVSPSRALIVSGIRANGRCFCTTFNALAQRYQVAVLTHTQRGRRVAGLGNLRDTVQLLPSSCCFADSACLP